MALLQREIFLNWGLVIPPDWRFGNDSYVNYFLHIVLGEFLLVLLTTFFYISEELIKLQNITIKLNDVEKEKVQAQLQGLKAQINPHFLFNTLNSIYSHSLTQSPKTPEMILMVSDLMSYMLYECNENKVPVRNDYLKKPFSLDRFIKAINKAAEKLNRITALTPVLSNDPTEDDGSIFINENRITYQVATKDIIYNEAVGDYVKIFTEAKAFITKLTLKKMEQLLPANKFIRVHKSFIIAVLKINKIDGNMIYLGTDKISLGHGYQKKFWEMINKKR